jgi:hypothetical protein
MKTTAREYWKEKFGEYPQNDAEKLAVAMMAEYADYANEQYSAMPNDFDEWIEKVEKECVIDMDLPIIIWYDFFKPRGIFPKHAKNNQ